MPEQNDNLVAALDLGNSTTRVMVAEALPSEEDPAARLRFVSLSETESQGWHKGNVADIGLLAASVRRALDQAEAEAGAPLASVVAGVGGVQLQGLTSRAALLLASGHREVRPEDVQQVLQDARNLPLPPERRILHLVPTEFVLDGQEGIRDPVGMQGSRLEVRVHAVTIPSTLSQNLVAAVNRAGVLVETLVGEGFAAGESAAAPEERELGVLVAVIGAAGCEIVAYERGGLSMARGLPLGGDHFTNDVSIGLHTPRADAESIKRSFGSVAASWSHDGTSFEVPGIGHQPSRLVPQKMLREILEARAQEFCLMVRDELRRCGLERSLGAGAILAGGGARLAGLCDLAEKMLDMPVRIGLPPKIAGMPETFDAPEYATVVGLLQYAQRLRRMRGGRAGSRWRELLTGKR